MALILNLFGTVTCCLNGYMFYTALQRSFSIKIFPLRFLSLFSVIDLEFIDPEVSALLQRVYSTPKTFQHSDCLQWRVPTGWCAMIGRESIACSVLYIALGCLGRAREEQSRILEMEAEC